VPILDDIFVEGPSLEDTYIPLSGDPSRWPSETLEKLLSDFPFFRESVIKTKITHADDKTHSMLGSHTIVFPNDQIIFPTIVRQGKLSPFDVFLYNGLYYPATETRIRLIISGRGLVESTTSEPEKSTSLLETTQTPELMTDQPTVYQKTSSILDKLAFTVTPAAKSNLLKYIRSNKDLVSLSKYPEVTKVFKKLVDLPVLDDDQYNTALSALLPVGIIQIRKNTDDTYTVLTSSDKAFHPVEHSMSAEELNAYLNSFMETSWPVIDSVNRGGEITVSMMDNSGSMAVLRTKIEDTLEVVDPGTYACKTDSGAFVKGKVIPLFDYLMQPLNMNIFYNSSFYSIQDRFAGEKTEDYEVPKGTEPSPGMVGTFIHKRKPIAVMPFTITSSHMKTLYDDAKAYYVKGVSLDNRPVEFRFSDTFKGWIKTSAPGEGSNVGSSRLLDEARERIFCVSSDDFVFVSLKDAVNLSRYANQFSKEAALRYGDRLKIKSDGSRFVMESHQLSKFASVPSFLTGRGTRKTFNFNDMDYNDAKFFLGSVGFDVPRTDEILKKAKVNGKVELVKVSFPQTIAERKEELIPKVKATLQAIPAIKASFVKQAAMTRDEVALDQTLGLNLVTPDNIIYFVNGIPEMQNTVERLASLLIFSRLGFKDVPERAIRDTMLGLEKILSVVKIFKIYLEQDDKE